MARRATACTTCRLPTSLCICGLVPRLKTRTRVVLVVPWGEARKPSNTGLLAARCLESSTVQIRHKRSGPLPSPFMDAGELPLVLFPAPDASPITDYANSPQRIALIVPDGSWPQARAHQQRGPLRQHKCVTLPSLGPSEYRIRSEPQPGGLATIEAIARALRILEGDAGETVTAAMLDVFRVMVGRTLWFRGKQSADEVPGGIPMAALVDDPRGTATMSRILASALTTSTSTLAPPTDCARRRPSLPPPSRD